MFQFFSKTESRSSVDEQQCRKRALVRQVVAKQTVHFHIAHCHHLTQATCELQSAIKRNLRIFIAKSSLQWRTLLRRSRNIRRAELQLFQLCVYTTRIGDCCVAFVTANLIIRRMQVEIIIKFEWWLQELIQQCCLLIPTRQVCSPLHMHWMPRVYLPAWRLKRSLYSHVSDKFQRVTAHGLLIFSSE